MKIGSATTPRLPVLQTLRSYGQPWRGVGLNDVGAGGPPPPSSTGAVSTTFKVMRQRGAASPVQANPGVQGTAANPPRGRHVDVRA